jgi:hypothetical protein
VQHNIWRRIERVGWWKKLRDEVDDVIVCYTDRLMVNVDVDRSLVLR